jgi:antitoxin (DNA-binding transcriptional repressor) of toxin-antitoxin stability system
MKEITKRELNQQTAQVLAEVRTGEPILVTERGVPRWRIEAVDGVSDPVARLRAAGRIIPASEHPMPWPADWGRETHGRTPADVDALLDEMRGDR